MKPSTILLVLALCGCGPPPVSRAQLPTVDLLAGVGLSVNGAGPMLVMADAERNRIVAANTLSSSLTVVDGASHAVTNIPLPGRAYQHLKAASMTIRPSTGHVYLVGMDSINIVSPDSGETRTIETGTQLESIAVHDGTGNAFATGRESGKLGFYDAKADEYREVHWLADEEKLENLNQTPPPPIRKVVVAPEIGKVLAIDGGSSTLDLFDLESVERVETRSLPLASGGRWHLAGYDSETHHLFLVTETLEREVRQAARIDVQGRDDVVVKLPGYREGVGMIYHPGRKELYVNYDNHPTVHVVTFEKGGSYGGIEIPSFGNDACVLDHENDLMYIGSWAQGELDVVDLRSRKLLKRIRDLGIIPHMHAMALNPRTGLVYFPRGASAVNGTFGAALTVLDPVSGESGKIRTGWAPVDLIELPQRDSFLVFSSEDQFAEVRQDGSYSLMDLPVDYPVKAVHGPDGDVYLSYGPHQSYWPVVYIWGARNGILTIDGEDLSYYDRRIFRQAMDMVVDEHDVLYFTQNNWGKEEQFLGVLEDGVREFQPSMRLPLVDEVIRENTQRILEYDTFASRLYLVRAGEKDGDPSILQVIDPTTRQVVHRVEVGPLATDLAYDEGMVYVSSLGASTVTILDTDTLEIQDAPSVDKPTRLLSCGGAVYALSHTTGAAFNMTTREVHEPPAEGLGDNMFCWKDTPVVTVHSPEKLTIVTSTGDVLHQQEYPYGDVRMDTDNVAFYLPGQFGDAVFSTTQGKTARDGRLWVTDFLAGKLYILD